MKPDGLVFDLDGTLWDTCDACAIAWNNVLRRLEIDYRPITGEDVRQVTGRPHVDCVRLTFTDLSEEQILAIADATTSEDILVINQLGGNLYPGVVEGLKALKERYRLFIVSNCQSGYIELFLELAELEDLFDDIECWGNTGHPKSENLRRVIERNGLVSPVMVGDTPGDHDSAKACQVPFAYVEYGFKDCESPEWSFSSFGELTSTFLSQT